MNGTENEMQAMGDGGTGRRPRVALMGEFSAGKSTLSNLLLDSDPLPVRVTATSVPPVWISYGEEGATLVGFDGTEEHLEIDALTSAALEEVKLVKLTMKSDILRLCDLMDMPGISDPNLDFDSWGDIVDEADLVIWCTHATQAWRQSEASSWDEIKDRTNGNNVLLVTQFDKLKSELDKARVLARLGKETNGAFKAIFPVALLEALNAGEDEQAWRLSGADEFIRFLVDMLSGSVSEDGDQMEAPETEAHAPAAEEALEAAPDFLAKDDETKILPKRVSTKSGARPRTRPEHSAAGISAIDGLSGGVVHGT